MMKMVVKEQNILVNQGNKLPTLKKLLEDTGANKIAAK